MATVRLRLATPADAAGVLAIYGPVVETSGASYEWEAPDLAEMERRIRALEGEYPWVVAEREGRILGYAYGSRHRPRLGYQWCLETTVYVAPDAHRRGLGRALYTALLALGRRQGFVMAYGGIRLPNEASVALHEALGFRHLGTFRNSGYKLGEWHDSGWWQLQLQEPPDTPQPPTPVRLLDPAEVRAALTEGERLLRTG